jgi:hypothetical protein
VAQVEGEEAARLVGGAGVEVGWKRPEKWASIRNLGLAQWRGLFHALP